MNEEADLVTSKFRALRERGGMSMDELAQAMGYSRASSIQRYEDPALYRKEFIAPDLVLKMLKPLVGKGVPPITAGEIWALARPDAVPGSIDARAEAIVKDGDEVKELDAKAGAGGGGTFDLINVTDGYDNQISAEVVKDHWRIPTSFLRGELRLDASKAVMIEVTGDSGYDPNNPHAPGSLFPGDRVIVNAKDINPTPPGLFLVYDGYGFVVKLCYPVHGSEPPAVTLASRNPNYPPYSITLDEGHAIVGRVVGRFTKM